MKTSMNLQASAAKTTNGTSSAGLVQGQNVTLLVNVTAFSGTTPNLVVRPQWSNDGTVWFESDTSEAFTANAGAVLASAKSFIAKAAYVRAAYAITGTTPSFTFTVDCFSID